MAKYRVVVLDPKSHRREAYVADSPDYPALNRALDVLREGGYEIISADRISEAEGSET